MTDYTHIGCDQEIDSSGLIYKMDSLFAFLLCVKDTRHAKGKIYSLVTLLVLMILAKLGGEDTPTGIAEWVANRVDQLVEMRVLPDARSPCHMTFRRVLQFIVTPEELESLIQQFHQSQMPKDVEAIYTMDGKTVRGTILGGETRGTHLLSVFAPEQGLVLAEAEVDRKENEIVVAPQILKKVNLRGAIILGDAMHTQRATSEQIHQANGYYIWTVKGNQARTEWAIQKLFMHEVCNVQQGAPLSKDIQVASQVNKGHGRREKRTIWVSSQLNDYLDWPGLQQVFRLERLIWHEKHHGSTKEVVYGMTNLCPQHASPNKLLRLVRLYWNIENGLHYRRDVTFHEDETRLAVGHSGHIMAILNNVVIGLCFAHGYYNLAKARRLFNANPAAALKLIFGS